MKHTLWHSDGNSLSYKPVRMKPLTSKACRPKPRTF
jgi:succinate dehydrogenase / fumarate reductase flavoprotein subunit